MGCEHDQRILDGPRVDFLQQLEPLRHRHQFAGRHHRAVGVAHSHQALHGRGRRHIVDRGDALPVEHEAIRGQCVAQPSEAADVEPAPHHAFIHVQIDFATVTPALLRRFARELRSGDGAADRLVNFQRPADSAAA